LKNLKRNAVVVVVLLFVCVAGYLNWSYNTKWGKPDGDMVLAEDTAMNAANEEYKNVFLSAQKTMHKQHQMNLFLSILQRHVSPDSSQETRHSVCSKQRLRLTMCHKRLLTAQ